MAVNKKPKIGLSNRERFPLIDNLGFLKQLIQDSHAPRYNFESGDRLEEPHFLQVKQYAHNIRHQKRFWMPGQLPDWMDDFLKKAIQSVPFYQERPARFADQPTICRKDIQLAPWNFVPTTHSLRDMLVYQTSGTTGPPMDVLFDPVSQACWIPQMESILDSYNITITRDPSRVAIAMICAQNNTLTYASLSTYLGGAGVLKLNLNAADWKQATDPAQYLETYNPEILTGDPFAFLALRQLAPNLRPKAMISSAMKLTSSVRHELVDHFQCPMIDVYSMTECRNIAFAKEDFHQAIRPELYLEVFDPKVDEVLPYGEMGELVVSGGNNPYLPLIRYRTGDHCRLRIENGVPCLYDLEAREPVLFYDSNKGFINNVDISRALSELPLMDFSLRQKRDYSLEFLGYADEVDEKEIRRALESVFGVSLVLNVRILPVNAHSGDKLIRYAGEWEVDL